MSTSERIPRIRIDPDGLDFETLRSEAIGKVQDLCGTIWTDYNLHDPGVTVLEQLCYGLTDLSYRAGFDVEDYLTGENDKIDYHRHGLLSPEEIFPSSAVTEIDFQKILYDAIPEIDYVWLESRDTENGMATGGLYTVFVKIDNDLIESQTPPLKPDAAMSRLSAELGHIRLASNKVYAQLDRLGHCLDDVDEMLRSGRDDMTDASLSAQDFAQYAERISEYLKQLDGILRYIEGIWERIDDLWSIVTDSASGDGLASRLTELLFKLEAVFNYTKLNELLSDLLPAFESSSEDWGAADMEMLAKLPIPLGRFEQALIKLTDMLLRIGNGLFSQVDISGQDGSRGIEYDEQTIKQKILRVFAQHRSLCEDIDRIEVIQTKPYFLVGQVEIRPSYSRAKIYAEIFFKCAHAISSGIQIERYESAFKQKGDYERIFSGPLTRHGFIDDRCFEVNQEVLNVVDLIALINQIEGVVQVRELYLMDQENRKHTTIPYDSSRYVFPDLSFPKAGKPKQVLRLVISQTAVHNKDSEGRATDFFSFDAAQNEALLTETRLELRRLFFEYHAFRENRPDFSQLIRLPEGQRRAFADYYSIQHHFPAIYGINRYGIPRSKPPEVKARAKQLKAYLFPYEQLMANFLQNLEEIPQLFSLNPALGQTYFSQFLTDRNIPDIESLYSGDEQEIQKFLTGIRAHYDRFAERRNRLLDTLLALYGETYPQRLLLQFDCYRRANPLDWIIGNKIHYLKHIREITRDRAGGFDYVARSWHGSDEIKAASVSGAHKRIALLLGLAQFEHVSMTADVLIGRNSRLVPDRVLAQGMRFLSAEMENATVPLPVDEGNIDKVAIPAALPVFGYSVFKAGVDLKNYRIIDSGRSTIVCLKSDQSDRSWPLGEKRGKAAAIRYAHEFCSTMTQLNIACESFHLVEHVLLRPRGGGVFDRFPDGASFFDFRISVIFPSWTVRFANPAFRKFAEETVVRNLPAHIFAEFYWLDFVYMQDFEQRYKNWLDCLHEIDCDCAPAHFERVDDAAEKLIVFLLKNRKAAGNEYWI